MRFGVAAYFSCSIVVIVAPVGCSEGTTGSCEESASCMADDASPLDASVADGDAFTPDAMNSPVDAFLDTAHDTGDSHCAASALPSEDPCTIDDAYGVFVSSSL